MDIPRERVRSLRPVYLAGGATVVVALLALGLTRVKPAAPAVEKSGVWIDTVRRGAMLRAVKGPGTLVPEHIRWITADTAGRVERIHLRPGAQVKADTLLVELSNPDVMLQSLEAERQVSSAEADLLALKSNLANDRLRQEATVAQLETDAADARRRAEADRKLHARAMLSDIDTGLSNDRAKDLAERLKLSRDQVAVLQRSLADRTRAVGDQLEKLRAVARFRKQLVDSMHVRSGDDGILQDLPLELGQWVVPGTLLAKVVQPGELKAELRIPETQAKDVALGEHVEIDTRNGIVPGHVRRVNPAASQGTVLVEVELEGALPKGARPDLTVEGTIEIEKLPDVLYVGRPAGAQPESTVELYRLAPGSDTAQRTRVALGRSSVNTIEVKGGLSEGDRVVLSDMSAWDASETVRLR
ncbi:MAG TPA: HlyD family efflux transporter periplasmic adaptor subunit [Myxococcaceae bacterium]|nr:HlyD family efflux transporter periplasmic adaptor subunit [Myxococcaceae bacterium]